MYGVGTNQLINDQIKQYDNPDFIGYYGYKNGYVYD
jgi:hypothetical protein